MDCLYCTWDTTTDLHCTDAHHPAHPVTIRVGIVTPETTREPVLSLALSTDDTYGITRDVATRMIDALKRAIARYDTLSKERDTKRQETSRRLVDAAVLTHTQWRDVLDGMTSGNAKRREAAATALKTAAPPRWLAEHPGDSTPKGNLA